MKILTTPWKDDFLELVYQSQESIKITSPFVKKEICEEVFGKKNRSTQFELITNFSPRSFCTGSLDLSAIELIIDQLGIVKSLPKLHSKIYLFDDKKAVIGSGNLTNGGLLLNYEYGILVEEPHLVQRISNDFSNLSNSLSAYSINNKIIANAKEFALRYSAQQTKLPHFDIEESAMETPQVQDEVRVTSYSLKGWVKDVFDCIVAIPKEEFNLSDAYKFELHLTSKHPNNNNIKDKIRQQLQNLRDLGIIEFLGNGNYRKLWNTGNSFSAGTI